MSAGGPEWRRARDVACVDAEAHVALLPLAVTPAGAPRILEGSAAVIWRALDFEARSEEDIFVDVAAAFEEPVDAVADAVRAFLYELEADHLVQRCH